jgi:hypothetical protein
MGDIDKHFGHLSLESSQKVIDLLRIIEVEQKKYSPVINVLDLDYGETGSFADVLYPWPFRYPAGVLANAVAGICRRDWLFYSFIFRLSHMLPLEPIPTKDIEDQVLWNKIIKCITLRNLINNHSIKYSECDDIFSGFNSKLNHIVQYGYYLLTRPRGKLNDITFLMGLNDDKFKLIEELYSGLSTGP